MNWPAMGMRRPGSLAPELREAFQLCRNVLLSAGLFSGLINLLSLGSSLYMLQVYDRVLPSHSVPTLVGLSIGMLILFSAFGVLDIVRTKLMARVAIQLDRKLRARVMSLVLRLPLRAGSSVDALQPVRDLDQVRTFASSGGPVALFDMPWMPFYLVLVWLLHPWLGMLALCGMIILIGLTFLTEMRSRDPTRDMAYSGAKRLLLAETHRRNAAAIQSMGMTGRVTQQWDKANEQYLADHTAATDVAGTYGSISRVLRLLLQSAVLGLGAYLVIIGQATGGVMIASSILVARALAPIEVAIANWRGFLSARQSVTRLSELLKADPEKTKPVGLPAPSELLKVDGMWLAPPGRQMPVVTGLSFVIHKGSALGIIGPSASGKSTLARTLIGAWPAMRGAVRLDGAALDQWATDDLGRHIGYLPQEVELIEGTVAQNIARFEIDAPDEEIVAAARKAGVHDMIVGLPNGYNTQIGESGTQLSAGQRQRVALARALYRDPFLVVLDEPNSNLDGDGEAALASAILGVRQRGGLVVLVAHRQHVLASVDHLLVLAPGQQPLFGTKDEVQKKLAERVKKSGPRSAPAAEAKPDAAAAAAQATLQLPAQPAQAETGLRLRIITDGS